MPSTPSSQTRRRRRRRSNTSISPTPHQSSIDYPWPVYRWDTPSDPHAFSVRNQQANPLPRIKLHTSLPFRRIEDGATSLVKPIQHSEVHMKYIALNRDSSNRAHAHTHKHPHWQTHTSSRTRRRRRHHPYAHNAKKELATTPPEDLAAISLHASHKHCRALESALQHVYLVDAHKRSSWIKHLRATRNEWEPQLPSVQWNLLLEESHWLVLLTDLADARKHHSMCLLQCIAPDTLQLNLFAFRHKHYTNDYLLECLERIIDLCQADAPTITTLQLQPQPFAYSLHKQYPHWKALKRLGFVAKQIQQTHTMILQLSPNKHHPSTNHA